MAEQRKSISRCPFKRYWGQYLRARGYRVASSGNVTDEVWMEYIKSQTQSEPDDDFRGS